jgi:hypothetical protein
MPRLGGFLPFPFRSPNGSLAQEAVLAGSPDERLISDTSLPFPLAPVRQKAATTGPSREKRGARYRLERFFGRSRIEAAIADCDGVGYV